MLRSTPVKKTILFWSVLNFLMVAAFAIAANAQTTAFTYQGRLTDTSIAANGTYQMQFALYDALTGGAQQGTTITNSSVSVVNGIFTVQLDFSPPTPFAAGADRWLEIAVKKPAETSYTTLTPRQQITSSPYSIRSASAATADTATTATTATNNVLKSGDAMTGQLVLSGNPTLSLGAATKQYVDSSDAQKVNLSGGTMSGTLNMGNNKITSLAAPTTGTDAANKTYVDTAAAAGPNYAYAYYYLQNIDVPFTIPSGGSVPFFQAGPVNGIVAFSGGTSFVLPDAGVYEVTWQVSVNEPGALVLALNGAEQPATIVGRSTSSTQIVGNVLINANAGDLLSVRAASGNSSALSLPPFAGSNLITGSLVIKRIR